MLHNDKFATDVFFSLQLYISKWNDFYFYYHCCGWNLDETVTHILKVSDYETVY